MLFSSVTMWVTSLGLAGEAGIFASLPFYPMFSGVPNGPLRLSPPQVHAAVHNSGSTKASFKGSKHDRGHLISSADRLEDALINSETFLLSNMSPQVGKFNRGVWKNLEGAVRKLSQKKITATVGKVKKKVWKYAEVYVICGPVFHIGSALEVIGDPKEIKVVIPHAFFKSVLAEQRLGKLELWSFLIPNKETKKDPSSFLVPAVDVERQAGLQLWDRLRGSEIEKLKAKKGKMWS